MHQSDCYMKKKCDEKRLVEVEGKKKEKKKLLKCVRKASSIFFSGVSIKEKCFSINQVFSIRSSIQFEVFLISLLKFISCVF